MNDLTQINVTLEISNLSQIVSLINTLDIHGIKLLKIENCLENSVSTKKTFQAITYSTKKKPFGIKGEEILALLSEGCTYQEIADRMEISVDGVRYYVKKIFHRLGVNNGRDAVRIYLTEMKKVQ